MLGNSARFAVLGGICALFLPAIAPASVQTLSSRIRLEAPDIDDQDDMCIWVHPSDPTKSTVVTSDKAANRLFVYDLAGEVIQEVQVPGMPGNIDLRYGLPLSGDRVDIVAYNDRDNAKVVVHRIDRTTRQLSRIDDGLIATGPNYGFCLYRSRVNGDCYAFTTSEDGDVAQYRLEAVGDRISGTLVRQWSFSSKTEGCVADDEMAVVYFSQEKRGIWKVDAEPDAPTTGVLIAAVGDASGLEEDVEGLTIYYAADGAGYLIASSQGSSDFRVYDRRAPHAFLHSFAVAGLGSTDGIDVTNVNLGPAFPSGLFAAHNGDRVPRPVELSAWEDVGLLVDTESWNPRGPIRELERRSEPAEVGYRDLQYGDEVTVPPTAEKPQNKLWWNDGSWWGVLWEPTARRYQIARYDSRSPAWVFTGTDVDDRPNSLVDVLWDGTNLYVASHVQSAPVGPARLYRYRYERGDGAYRRDDGFPVDVHDHQMETLTIAKDTTGKLWATWEVGGFIWVNRTLGDDRTWGVPFMLPVPGATVMTGDISAIVAFGDKIGIAWSYQPEGTTRFAFHRDGSPDEVWHGPEEPLLGTGVKGDDHFNLKTFEGCVYLVTKTTTTTPGEPLIYFAKRDRNGQWTQSIVGTHDDGHTRAILLIDEDHRLAHVFATTAKAHPGQVIRRKSADLDDPVFAPGLGEPFIASATDGFVNDASSTRQNVTRETGVLVLASDAATHRYLHNFLSLEDVVYVDDVALAHREEGPRHVYSAQVSIRNGLRSALEGVTVTARWSGALSATRSVRTDASGVATFPTMTTRRTDAITFCVIDVAYGAYAYDSASNGETCGSLRPVPLGGNDGGGLIDNHPNPFRSSTTIRLSLARKERVLLTIYDVLGREVRTLVDGEMPEGEHNVAWDGRDGHGEPTSAGVYLYRLETAAGIRVKKMSLVR
jgi:myo-inositol-hexaphosphate 3-phosphohydrolase